MRAVNIQSCIHLYAHAINLKLRDNFQETHTEHYNISTCTYLPHWSLYWTLKWHICHPNGVIEWRGTGCQWWPSAQPYLMNLMHTLNSLNQHSGMVKCWHGHTDFPILYKNHTKWSSQHFFFHWEGNKTKAKWKENKTTTNSSWLYGKSTKTFPGTIWKLQSALYSQICTF